MTPPGHFLLRQDVAFFDAHRTGQLVSRLTTDIQEFKSSFKLVISQVQETGLLGKPQPGTGREAMEGVWERLA